MKHYRENLALNFSVLILTTLQSDLPFDEESVAPDCQHLYPGFVTFPLCELGNFV